MRRAVSSPPHRLPLDKSETQYALHVGAEHRFNSIFSVFGRAARSFRLPTVDERVGIGAVRRADQLRSQDPDLARHRRWRARHYRSFSVQTSVFDMQLKDESCSSVRRPSPTSASIRPAAMVPRPSPPGRRPRRCASRLARLYPRGVPRRSVRRQRRAAGVAVERQRRGVMGHLPEVPGVRCGGASTARASWTTTSANVQPRIPGQGIFDVRIGGEYQTFFWSFSVQNLFSTKVLQICHRLDLLARRSAPIRCRAARSWPRPA